MTVPARRPTVPSLALSILAVFVLLALPGVAGAFQGLEAVGSRDGIDVWAVGDSSGWRRSLDGGATWNQGNLSPAGIRLRGVAARGFTVLVAGDGGRVWRSTDLGGTWNLDVLPGSPDLHDLAYAPDGTAFAAGADGRVYRSLDDGVSWAAVGPAGAPLRGLDTRGGLAVFAVGDGGRVMRSKDGGDTWDVLTAPTTHDLLEADQMGSTVWIVGSRGTALRSDDAGDTWSEVPLRMDSAGDVTGVAIAGADSVHLAGGGGFLRTTTDGGATWTFAVHPMVARASALHRADNGVLFLASPKTRAVLRSTDGGATAAFPAGTSQSLSWSLRQGSGGSTIRGNSFGWTPQAPRSVWAVMGANVYKSLDEGETWALIASIPGVFKTNSFYVSPRDSATWVAASGTPDRILTTKNSGASWSSTLSRDFSEYGQPLEMNPDRPDSLLFGPEDGRIWQSLDFGATWAELSNPGFRSPCDLVITPDSTTNVLVGDGVTGVGLAKIWRSDNNATTFADRYTSASSETPTVWTSRLSDGVMFATNWSSGGVWRSANYGQNWSQVSTVSSAWGGVTAPDDPKLVMFNRYAGTPNYLSTDGGATYTGVSSSLSGSGYGQYAIDRATLLDMHSSGIYKLRASWAPTTVSAQSLALSAPDGGETWTAGSTRSVTWSASNVALARIEYRTAPAEPWQEVALVAGTAGQYDWLVPATPTTQAEVRVSDAWDASPADQSSAVFTIEVPIDLALDGPDGGESWQSGTSHDITWSSTNLAEVAIDYRTGEAEPWIELVAQTPAAPGAWSWLVPFTPTAEARVRVREVGGGLVDTSAGLFAIVAPRFLASPDPFVLLGPTPAGTEVCDTLVVENPGTAPLTVSSVVSDNPAFRPGRASFVIPAGGRDTLSVCFAPLAVGPDSATFAFTADDSAGSHAVLVRGEGGSAVAAGDELPLAFALQAARPSPFGRETTVRFALPRASEVALEVFDVAGRRVAVLARGRHVPGYHAVTFRPSAGERGAGRSGVYFIRLRADGFEATQKVVHLAR